MAKEQSEKTIKEETIKRVEKEAKDHLLPFKFPSSTYEVEEAYDDEYALAKIHLDPYSGMREGSSLVIIGFNPNRKKGEKAEETYNKRHDWLESNDNTLLYYDAQGKKYLWKGEDGKCIVKGRTIWNEGVKYGIDHKVQNIYFLDICPTASNNKNEISSRKMNRKKYEQSIGFINKYINKYVSAGDIILATGTVPKYLDQEIYNNIITPFQNRIFIIGLNKKHGYTHPMADGASIKQSVPITTEKIIKEIEERVK